jgi:hypothetical protein
LCESFGIVVVADAVVVVCDGVVFGAVASGWSGLLAVPDALAVRTIAPTTIGMIGTSAASRASHSRPRFSESDLCRREPPEPCTLTY